MVKLSSEDSDVLSDEDGGIRDVWREREGSGSAGRGWRFCWRRLERRARVED
jgi:hypothetical protein